MELKKAAINFDKLCKKKYRFTVAKKGKSYKVDLNFEKNQFYHLVGIQHLTDINSSYTNAKAFFVNVIKDKINVETLLESCFYEEYKIEDRIEIVKNLESYLDSPDLKFRKYDQSMGFSKIRADYILIKISNCEGNNIFIKKRNDSANFCLVSCNKSESFFSKSNSLSVIYKEKIIIKNNESNVLIDKVTK